MPSSSVSAFFDLASAFCAWCEDTSPGADRTRQLAAWLARLHGAALSLPAVSGDEGGDAYPDLPEEALQRAKANFAPLMGCLYREHLDLDPWAPEQAGMGDIGDDVLDTYQDIKRGLLLHEAGMPNHALWFWSYMHGVHWGRHVVGAMYAIHCLWSNGEMGVGLEDEGL